MDSLDSIRRPALLSTLAGLVDGRLEEQIFARRAGAVLTALVSVGASLLGLTRQALNKRLGRRREEPGDAGLNGSW